MKPISAKSLGLDLRALRSAPAGRLGAGVLPKPKMNGLESRYAALLENGMRAGSVLWWAFEGLSLRLADDTRYTPDFAVMAADGVIECHETKGFMREAARVRLNVAAATYPFRFFLVRAGKSGAWQVDRV
jgi:hypothetical protein